MSQSLWKGIISAVILFTTCYLGTLIMLLPFVPLALKWRSAGRRIMDFFLWLWFTLAVLVYEWVFGVKIVIHGNPAPSGDTDSVLILCNHRTRLDWLFLMSYQLRCGNLSHYRISLKSGLKNIPGPGWAMQCAGFLFLQRNWKKDQEWINQSLKYFAEIGTQPQFLLFPEGTDLCENGLAKSHKFAEANGLPKYDYVLHPRTTGFVHFVNKMRENKILDSVLDVTVAYPKNIVHSEADFAKGLVPQEVHFYVQNHPVTEIPESNAKLEEWCQKVWQKKEAALERFYAEKTFAVNGENTAVSIEKENSVQIVFAFVIAFWTCFLLAFCYSFFVFPLFKWYVFLSTITFVFISRKYGGVDSLLYLSNN